MTDQAIFSTDIKISNDTTSTECWPLHTVDLTGRCSLQVLQFRPDSSYVRVVCGSSNVVRQTNGRQSTLTFHRRALHFYRYSNQEHLKLRAAFTIHTCADIHKNLASMGKDINLLEISHTQPSKISHIFFPSQIYSQASPQSLRLDYPIYSPEIIHLVSATCTHTCRGAIQGFRTFPYSQAKILKEHTMHLTAAISNSEREYHHFYIAIFKFYPQSKITQDAEDFESQMVSYPPPPTPRLQSPRAPQSSWSP